MKYKSIIVALVLTFCTSCADSELGRMRGNVEGYKVTMYSGGKVVGEWESVGMVRHHQMGYYFIDRKTKKIIVVLGDVVMEEIQTQGAK